jgi:hypothetical protein
MFDFLLRSQDGKGSNVTFQGIMAYVVGKRLACRIDTALHLLSNRPPPYNAIGVNIMYSVEHSSTK